MEVSSWKIPTQSPDPPPKPQTAPSNPRSPWKTSPQPHQDGAGQLFKPSHHWWSERRRLPSPPHGLCESVHMLHINLWAVLTQVRRWQGRAPLSALLSLLYNLNFETESESCKSWNCILNPEFLNCVCQPTVRFSSLGLSFKEGWNTPKLFLGLKKRKRKRKKEKEFSDKSWKKEKKNCPGNLRLSVYPWKNHGMQQLCVGTLFFMPPLSLSHFQYSHPSFFCFVWCMASEQGLKGQLWCLVSICFPLAELWLLGIFECKWCRRVAIH